MPNAPLPRGATVSRYLILGVVGEGGMGRVYDAYDPQLDRRLALKLMLVGGDDVNKQRLLREARTMARVSHPGVVAVHDAGEVGDQVFVAMDLIEGTTLAKWVRSEKPPLAEILRVFRAAGRGLAAAHAAGLVHRDFKPANVLLGAAGRVAVTDFGLAREVGARGSESHPALPELATQEFRTSDSQTIDPLTLAGMVSGTPQYMSPEQFAGQPLDARADQFAFCVAFWDALYGNPPYPASTLQELVTRVTNGNVQQPVDRKKVPAHIHKALLRGISVRAEQRFPSMDALLDEIVHDTGVGARRVRWASIAAVGLALVAGVGYRVAGARSRACAESLKTFNGVLTPRARDAARDAFKNAMPKLGADTFTSVESALDTWVGTWKDTHRAVCGAGSGGLFDNRVERQLGCLDELRLSEAALVAALGRVTRESAQAASEAVLGLPQPEQCTAPAALAVPTSKARAKVRGRVVESSVLTSMLNGKDGEARGLEAVDLAQQANLPDEEARAWLQVSLARTQQAKLDEAEEATVEAIVAAERSGEQRDVALAWTQRMNVNAAFQAHYAAALEAGRHADAAAGRVGGDPYVTTRVDSLRGLVLMQTGRPGLALEPLRRALMQAERSAGKEHFSLVRILMLLTNAARGAGERDEALAAIDRALAIQTRILPPVHPLLAGTLNAKGRVLLAMGKIEEAVAAHQRALSILGASMPGLHPEITMTLAMIAEAQRANKTHREARATFQEALDQAATYAQPDHPLRSTLERDIGKESLALGELRPAAESLARALAGPWPREEKAQLQATLAQTLFKLEDWSGVAAAAKASLDQTDNAELRFLQAQALFEQGLKPQAKTQAERALKDADPGLAQVIGKWLAKPTKAVSEAKPGRPLKPKKR